MSAPATIAPFPAIISAVARPILAPAPVTSTTLSASIVIGFLLFIRRPGEGRDPLTSRSCLGTVDTGLRRYDDWVSCFLSAVSLARSLAPCRNCFSAGQRQSGTRGGA